MSNDRWEKDKVSNRLVFGRIGAYCMEVVLWPGETNGSLACTFAPTYKTFKLERGKMNDFESVYSIPAPSKDLLASIGWNKDEWRAMTWEEHLAWAKEAERTAQQGDDADDDAPDGPADNQVAAHGAGYATWDSHQPGGYGDGGGLDWSPEAQGGPSDPGDLHDVIPGRPDEERIEMGGRGPSGRDAHGSGSRLDGSASDEAGALAPAQRTGKASLAIRARNGFLTGLNRAAGLALSMVFTTLYYPLLATVDSVAKGMDRMARRVPMGDEKGNKWRPSDDVRFRTLRKGLYRFGGFLQVLAAPLTYVFSLLVTVLWRAPKRGIVGGLRASRLDVRHAWYDEKGNAGVRQGDYVSFGAKHVLIALAVVFAWSALILGLAFGPLATVPVFSAINHFATAAMSLIGIEFVGVGATIVAQATAVAAVLTTAATAIAAAAIWTFQQIGNLIGYAADKGAARSERRIGTEFSPRDKDVNGPVTGHAAGSHYAERSARGASFDSRRGMKETVRRMMMEVDGDTNPLLDSEEPHGAARAEGHEPGNFAGPITTLESKTDASGLYELLMKALDKASDCSLPSCSGSSYAEV